MGKAASPTAADLFCGAGGMTLGLGMAGFQVVLAADHDQDSLATMHLNMPEVPARRMDLSDQVLVSTAAIAATGVDLVVAGPPCQSYSQAGASRRRSLGVSADTDGRSDLWMALANVVASCHPAAVVMENVLGMASAQTIWRIAALLGCLEAQGYWTDVLILNASDHGVPQSRRRLFVTANAAGPPGRPTDRPGRRVSVRDAIGNLPPIHSVPCHPPGQDDMAYAAPPAGRYDRYARAGSTRLYDHMGRAANADDIEAFRLLISTGGRYADLPERLKRYRQDIFTDKFRVLAWDSPSPTVVAHLSRDGYSHLHPSQPRSITVREAARLQSFPDRWRFCGSMSSKFRQVGNAVPPLLAASVAAAVTTPDTSLERSSQDSRFTTGRRRLTSVAGSSSTCGVPTRHAERLAMRFAGLPPQQSGVVAARAALARLLAGRWDDLLPSVEHLAATVCSGPRPQCGSCPLADTCAYAANRVSKSGGEADGAGGGVLCAAES